MNQRPKFTRCLLVNLIWQMQPHPMKCNPLPNREKCSASDPLALELFAFATIVKRVNTWFQDKNLSDCLECGTESWSSNVYELHFFLVKALLFMEQKKQSL